MKKNFLSKALACTLALSIASTLFIGCGSASKQTSDSKDLKGNILVWHFNKDEGPKLTDAFNAAHPNIKATCQITPDTDLAYQNKIQNLLNAGGSGMPDVFFAESAFVKRFANLKDGFENLSDSKYDANKLIKNMYPYTVDIGRDNSGKIRCLTWQVTPGAVGYKKDLAKQYLGTDDPEKIADMISTPDKMLDTGKKLKEASGGKVRLWAGIEELLKIYLGGRSTGWVKDNKLVIDPKLDEFLDLAKKIRDNGYDSAYGQWTPAWSASVGASDSLLYAIPTWGIANIIASNDKKAAGRWGLAQAPFPYSWGGTWIGIYSKSKKKDLAWEFVKFLTGDEKQMKSWSKSVGDVMNNTEVIKSNAAESDTDKTVGVNVNKFFQPMLGNIKGNLITQYDDAIQKDFLDLTNSYLANKMSKDQMITQFKAKVKSDFSDLTVN